MDVVNRVHETGKKIEFLKNCIQNLSFDLIHNETSMKLILKADLLLTLLQKIEYEWDELDKLTKIEYRHYFKKNKKEKEDFNGEF